jgi:hypothetical protein
MPVSYGELIPGKGVNEYKEINLFIGRTYAGLILHTLQCIACPLFQLYK